MTCALGREEAMVQTAMYFAHGLRVKEGGRERAEGLYEYTVTNRDGTSTTIYVDEEVCRCYPAGGVEVSPEANNHPFELDHYANTRLMLQQLAIMTQNPQRIPELLA